MLKIHSYLKRGWIFLSYEPWYDEIGWEMTELWGKWWKMKGKWGFLNCFRWDIERRVRGLILWCEGVNIGWERSVGRERSQLGWDRWGERHQKHGPATGGAAKRRRREQGMHKVGDLWKGAGRGWEESVGGKSCFFFCLGSLVYIIKYKCVAWWWWSILLLARASWESSQGVVMMGSQGN